jgi:hypothetical protein
MRLRFCYQRCGRGNVAVFNVEKLSLSYLALRLTILSPRFNRPPAPPASSWHPRLREYRVGVFPMGEEFQVLLRRVAGTADPGEAAARIATVLVAFKISAYHLPNSIGDSRCRSIFLIFRKLRGHFLSGIPDTRTNHPGSQSR